jgi:triosephosphate isomerase (TIM)
MNRRRKLMLGNWKMHHLRSDLVKFGTEFRQSLCSPLASVLEQVDVGIAPSFLCLETLTAQFPEHGWWNVAQNAHYAATGAFTGEISIPMLHEIGITKILVGHSERRQYFAESDQVVGKKVQACFERGMHPIICVGETLEIRKMELAEKTIESQIRAALQHCPPGSSFTIAYEPVWAIGTGIAATARQAQDMHQFIRRVLADLFGESVAIALRILYGGSTKPENISELLSQPDIDGALIGGASLDGGSLARMINSAVSV